MNISNFINEASLRLLTFNIRDRSTASSNINDYLTNITTMLEGKGKELIYDTDVMNYIINDESNEDDELLDSTWSKIYDTLFYIFPVLYTLNDGKGTYLLENIQELYLNYLIDIYLKVLENELSLYIFSPLVNITLNYIQEKGI